MKAALNRGFTLIEVLIAMTLLSVIVVLLFASLRICAQSWEQGETKITEINEVAVVYHFFQQYLASAKPVANDFADDGTVSYGFQGDGQNLNFVTALPASVERSGLQQFAVNLVKDHGEQFIRITLTPFFPLAEGEQWRQDQVILIKHVKNLEISYFGSDDGVSPGVWMPDWMEKEVQPQLVKIRIALDNNIYWPEMVIKLNVSGVYSNQDFESETEDGDSADDDTDNPGLPDNGE